MSPPDEYKIHGLRQNVGIADTGSYKVEIQCKYRRLPVYRIRTLFPLEDNGHHLIVLPCFDDFHGLTLHI